MEGSTLLLKELGFNGVESLFSDIPSGVRKKNLNISNGISEFELIKKSEHYAGLNGRHLILSLGAPMYLFLCTDLKKVN